MYIVQSTIYYTVQNTVCSENFTVYIGRYGPPTQIYVEYGECRPLVPDSINSQSMLNGYLVNVQCNVQQVSPAFCLGETIISCYLFLFMKKFAFLVILQINNIATHI